MEEGQRKMVAAAVLVVSMIVVGYLLFFTPPESALPDPSPTVLQRNATPDETSRMETVDRRER